MTTRAGDYSNDQNILIDDDGFIVNNSLIHGNILCKKEDT
jgi:hypothetical protein